MEKVNLLMWVTNVDSENEILWAEGHLEEEDSTYGMRHELKLSFDWIKENCREEDFEELQQLGRLFYYEIYEDGREELSLTTNEPFTQEQIDAINKRASEWSSNLKWE